MKNKNDIDSDLTKRFDMEELKREMERETRLNRIKSYSSNAATQSNAQTQSRASTEVRYSNPRSARRDSKKYAGHKTKFKKGLKKYILFLCTLSVLFLIYVMNTLYQYEDSFTDNYMAKVISQINKTAKNGKISQLCDVSSLEINKLDNSGKNYNDAIKQVFKNEEITYKPDDKTKNSNNPVYYIYANNKQIMEVTLKIKERKQRLGLFAYPVWEIDNCKLASERGLEYYDIYVPSDYVVEVNGTKLGNSYISDKTTNEDYEKFAEYIKLPNMVNYELNNFLEIPEIKITDSKGNSVESLIKNNKIEIANSYITAATYEDAKQNLKGDIDILKLAENWSLFLTDDLNGGTQHGFSLLKPYLITNSNFYNMAYAWATSIDITFVSTHTLKNPTFTNETLSDFVIYNEKAFSCSVYLEKNMRIANGNDKVDIMHDKLYFVYYDDSDDEIDNPSWKLIDMKSIVDN